MFVAGHTDTAGKDAHNDALSDERARAVLALPFDCHPGKLDDNASTGESSVRKFQEAYNENEEALGAEGEALAVDGDVGLLTWGAIFDCYEFALRGELGEDAEGLKSLRDVPGIVQTGRKAAEREGFEAAE